MNKLICFIIVILGFLSLTLQAEIRDNLSAHKGPFYHEAAQKNFNYFPRLEKLIHESWPGDEPHPGLYLKAIGLASSGETVQFDDGLIWTVHPLDRERVKSWDVNDVYFIFLKTEVVSHDLKNDLCWEPVFYIINYTKKDNALAYLDFVPDPNQTKTLTISLHHPDQWAPPYNPYMILSDQSRFMVDIFTPHQSQIKRFASWQANDRVIIVLGDRIWDQGNNVINLDRRQILSILYWRPAGSY